MKQPLRHGVLVILAATVWAGAAAAGPTRAPRLTVFAASSLTDVFPAIDKAATYSFGGSNALATQIENGAPADVFASADTKLPAQLHAAGLVEKPVDFTRNKLVIVVPKANRSGVSSIGDLAKPGVKVDIADPSVPVGGYTLKVLAKLGLTSKIVANVVSREPDVRTVLTKVALGQADAGFVYSTDAKSAAGKVTVIQIPASAQPSVSYALAVVTKSPNQTAAQAFVREVLSKAGQAKLAAYGFLPLPTTS